MKNRIIVILSLVLIFSITLLTACQAAHDSSVTSTAESAEETRAPKEVEVVADADPVALARDILASPGKVYVLGNGSGEVKAALDVNQDGVSETVSVKGRDSAGYDFAVDEAVQELAYLGSTEDTYEWDLVAVSPDGELILIGINTRTAGNSSSVVNIYIYDGAGLTGVFSEAVDILDESTWIDADEITAKKQTSAPLVNHVLFRWTADENGKYQAAYDDMYDFLDENTIELYATVPLYSAPSADSEKTADIGPQKVSFLKTDLGIEKNKNGMSAFLLGGAQCWMYLRTESGQEGWVQIGDFVMTGEGEMNWFAAYGFLD